MFLWNFILRNLFTSTSPRAERKARRPRPSVKLELEELTKRILPSASPGNPQPDQQPLTATLVQEAIQVIVTVENDVASLDNRL